MLWLIVGGGGGAVKLEILRKKHQVYLIIIREWQNFIANLTLQSKTGNVWNCLSIIDECKNSICDASNGCSLEKFETDLKILNQVPATKLDKRQKIF